MSNDTPVPDEKTEDAQIAALSNALITSFLGSVATGTSMSDSAQVLEYILNAFITGPHPPIKGWFIAELACYPLVRMRVMVLTHQDVEHIIVLQVDQQSMAVRSEEEPEDED